MSERDPDSSGTEGRDRNAAIPGGKPDASTSDKAVRKVGEQSTRAAGPDGPDARAIGDTFKRSPGGG